MPRKRKRKDEAAPEKVAETEKEVKEKEVSKVEKRKKQKTEPDNAGMRIAGYAMVSIKLNSFPGERYIYYKEHVNKGDDDEKVTPSGRTLILVNIPVEITAQMLSTIFSQFGKIFSVTFKRLVPVAVEQKSHSSSNHNEGQRGIFAHLVFTSPKSVAKAIKFQWESPITLPEPEGLGLEKWLESYKGTRPDSANILAEVDAFMYDFDKQQEKARLETEKNFGKPDQDGFILVQRGRGKLRDGKVNVTATKVTPELIEKSKKTAVLDDFYRFQRRENMRKQLADLRIRFEEDKKRIAKMRAQRRFRPG